QRRRRLQHGRHGYADARTDQVGVLLVRDDPRGEGRTDAGPPEVRWEAGDLDVRQRVEVPELVAAVDERRFVELHLERAEGERVRARPEVDPAVLQEALG